MPRDTPTAPPIVFPSTWTALASGVMSTAPDWQRLNFAETLAGLILRIGDPVERLDESEVAGGTR
jgi:hypothetical protein